MAAAKVRSSHPLTYKFSQGFDFPLDDFQIESLHCVEDGNGLLVAAPTGAGKTVVALAAMLTAVQGGHQAALMAPTEILAQQHFAKLVGWLSPLGVRVAWLTGSQKKKERTEMLALIASGQAALVVGTHAVIQEQVKFKNLALAIIDEQHRFGVAQRLALMNRKHA